ncbi:MAG TPA: SDR family oxidoreductase [Microbacteriaceae bacterium]|nr:SDR family oxidoreductase [Microbacteriaceae bacterium]
MSDAMTRAAIVTGGTGGVGAATVALLRSKGYGVVSVDLAPAPEAWSDDDGIVALSADVALEATAELAVRTAQERFGRLDVLVNNAGLFHRKDIATTSVADLERLLRVNVIGTFVFTRAAIDALAATGGAIVNLGSISGLVGSPQQGAYSITKGAIIQFTRQSAIELAPQGIRVNAVAPGAIDTEFVGKAVAHGSSPGNSNDTIRQNNPLGRISSAEEIADAIVWLASSPAVTGAVLSVDGGHTAR